MLLAKEPISARGSSLHDVRCMCWHGTVPFSERSLELDTKNVGRGSHDNHFDVRLPLTTFLTSHKLLSKEIHKLINNIVYSAVV